ncbi:hypothetical protein B0T11DRAFT_201713, partial [Plectosphaerella cucumerina]
MMKYHLRGKIEADETVIPIRRLASTRRSSGQLWCRGLRPISTRRTRDAEERRDAHIGPFHLQDSPERTSSSGVRTVLAADPVPVVSLRPLPSLAMAASQRAFAGSFTSFENDDSLLLHSTPYTLNMPTFRHGPIRIPKSGALVSAKIMPDRTLDWTAFQVAILGGAGDLCSGGTDITRRSEDELEDIADWFDGFGFESAGRLVRGRHSAPA